MATLTTANSSLLLMIENLYPVPQSIEGYATDDAFASDDIQMGEIVMGVDGGLSAGYTPNPTPLVITLQADSPSNQIFDDWIAAEKATRDKFIANIYLSIPSISNKFALVRGFLATASQIPGGKKILQPRNFRIEFEDCAKSPI
jgi:hypothetical protein